MKKFVTIFPKLENIHLVKDVGMIPYILYKEFGFESTIVSFNNGSYPYIKSELRGLQQKFLFGNLKYSTIYRDLFLVLFVIKNSRKIDVLNLYHFQINNMFIMTLYKRLNPKGLCFLKLDSQYRISSKDKKYKNSLTGVKLGRLRWRIKKILCKNIDIMSAESRDTCRDIGKVLGRKIEYIPNGYIDMEPSIDEQGGNKENIFLTIGRLGTLQKNTDMLIDAYLNIYKECDWNLVLIGSIEEKEKSRLESLYKDNCDLENRIFYMGEISDRKVLFSHYKRAKVFLMPSKWESFSLATAEALSQGCYVILSDGVAPWKEFTDNGKMGAVVQKDSIKQLSDMMLKSTKMELNHKEISDYAKENFYWPSVCEKLKNLLLEEKR